MFFVLRQEANVYAKPIADIRGVGDGTIMLSSLTLASAVAVTSAFQATPPAATEEEEPYVLMSLAARQEKCNLALATKVDLPGLINEPQKWTGRCIAIDGYWHGRALFASRKDALRPYAQSNDALNKRRVGLYGTKELLSSAPRAPLAYTAVGIAGECEALGEGAIMVMGYCHYTGGPYIALAEMRRR